MIYAADPTPAPGFTPLVEFLRESIRARGPVSFAWFMEQALYHPEHGYYSSGRAAIGRGGDYLTNVSVGPVFGQLMAAQFAELWETLGAPGEFVIVEQGAHNGDFARDVLVAAQQHWPGFFEALRYRIVEPFPALRRKQEEALARWRPKISWHESLETAPAWRGIHFSNELLDSMPVHLFRWTGNEWLERHVIELQDRFAFTELPITNADLQQQLAAIPMPLPAGYQTEINVAALRWVDVVARKLVRGFVVAVDYGFPRDEFYAPHRQTGTLQCYSQHRVVPSPLLHVGAADITAHVEWSSIAERAERRGLQVLGLPDQHHFITGLLASGSVQELAARFNPSTRRALQTLLHPGFFGMKFQFLVLGKNAGAGVQLAGLRFARDARAAPGGAPPSS